MGTNVAVNVIEGDADAPARALARLVELERRWSRFRPDSELSRVSARPGRWTPVARETVALLEAARRAWEATAGACDVTGGAAIMALGYDRTLEEVIAASTSGVTEGDPRPFPGFGAVELDPGRSVVRVAAGCVLDVGAIGKGFAADLVADEMHARGARGVLVDVGGDIAVRGEPPEGGQWLVPVDLDVARTWRWCLDGGGVATSSSVRRTWRRGGRPVQHVLDPRTGRPVVDPPRAVSVVAGTAWWAEAVATALMVMGDDARVAAAERLGAIAVVAGRDASIRSLGDVGGRGQEVGA